MLWHAIKGAFTCEGVSDAHAAIALRCWPAMMIGFIYGIFFDHYARTHGVAAVQEPGGLSARWKYDLLEEVSTWIGYMKLDIMTMRTAMAGADGNTAGVFKVLGQVAEWDSMKADMTTTFEDAREISEALLKHEDGLFDGMSKLVDLEGMFELDGHDAAVININQVPEITHPEEEVTAIEADLLVQICWCKSPSSLLCCSTR